MRNTQSFVSIIIVNHNGENLIKACLDSLLKIDYPKNKLEIIVIDNCSQDGSVEFIKNRYRRIKIIRSKLNNYCRSCNIGIRKARGKYIVLLNNDVRVTKRWLLELVKIMESDNSIGAVTGKLLNDNGTIQNAGLYELPNFYWDERGAGEESKDYNSITEIDAISGACVLYRKETLDNIGLLDEDFVMFVEDVDMSFRLKQRGWRLLYVPASAAYHKFHGSCDENFARSAIEKNRLLFIAKHYPYKLANALLGSGYFIVDNDNQESGQFFNLMSDIFLKLSKHHSEEVVREVLKEILIELKRIVNYENKKLSDNAKSLLFDLIETRKDRDSQRNEKENKEQHLQQLSDELNTIRQELSGYKDEVSILSGKLRESLDSGLNKDRMIHEREQELHSIYASKGMRFIVKPLQQIVWYSQTIFKYLIKKICNCICTTVIISISPVILLQVVFFLIEWIAEILFGRFLSYFNKKRDVVSFDNLTISAVIPSWNGIDLLKECLSSLYEIENFRDGKYEILVVDDTSNYDIAKLVKDGFPKVKVIRNKRNQGFGRSCNRGVKEAKGELIVLLNNDIKVTRDFLESIKAHFRNEDVFAVSPKLYYWDKKTFNYGFHMGKFENGYISLWNESETGNGDRISQTSPTIFAVGGAMVFRKRDFLWLGGFDDIYRPNCWEDIDISYRAQKRGLKVLYEPKSLAYHKGGATLNYVRHKEIKNELLFMWKNISNRRMLASHFNQIPKFMYFGRHSNRLTFLIGYFWAFNYIIPAIINRFMERGYFKVTDKKILNRCMLYYRNFMRNNYVHPQKKTVLIITPFIIYPLNSGGRLRIYNLYKRLSKQYRLILLSLIHNEYEMEYTPHLKEIFDEIFVVHTKTPSNEFLFPRCYRYSFSNFLIDKLKEIQNKTPVDIVQIESNEMLYLTRYIKYTPIIYTEHDISILSYNNSYYKKDMTNILFNFIDYLKLVRFHNLFYKNIDKIITLSNSDRNIIKSFSPQSDCALIPTGVDLEHFHFSQKNGAKKSLIFVGHYPHYPNEEAAVYFCRHIFPLIKKTIPDITIKLVGSEPAKAIMNLSDIEGVEVIGAVSDVNPYLQEASIFVNAFKRSAGIKGKVLEAMAAGTPVVCTSQGAYGIDAIDGEDILIANNPRDFAKNVIGLLTDEVLFKKIAYNARKLVEEKYDWNKIAAQLDSVYRDITKSSDIDYKDAAADINVTKITYKQDYNSKEIENIIKKVDRIVDLSLKRMGSNKILNTDLFPEELHIELTHRCNSKCITCDVWDYHQRTNKNIKDELSLDEIKNFIKKSQYLNDIKTVVLSGGEPFLRQDIVDICLATAKTLPHASVGILTNAINTESVISKTKMVLDKSKLNSFWVGTSLDGIGDVYDRIRGTQGGFERFVKTIEGFKKELSNIKLSATFVLTPFNIDQLIPCWEFADRNGLDFFAQFGVPKSVRSTEVFRWTDDELAKAKECIKHIIEKIITKHSNISDFSSSLSTIKDKINLLTNIYYWSHLVDFQQTKARFSHKCDAGFKFAMFTPYGDMFFCPLLKERTIGNIRMKDFDALWHSNEADNVRGFIDTGKCSCWLVCTVFPIVGRALSLYGDDAIVDATESNKLNDNIIKISTYKDNAKSYSELNNEEFRDKKIILQSTPQGITIGSNYRCNANCIFCLGGDYKPFSLSLYKDYFAIKLGSILEQADYVSFCGMGELLSIPDIEKFLDYINNTLPNKNKILTTNGLALNENILEKIIKSRYSLQISLHASNPVLHSQIVGVNGGFDKIIKQIRHLVSIRKNNQSPYIVLVFLITAANIEDLPTFVDLAAFLGVDCIQCNYLTIFKPAHLKLSCFFKQRITNEMFDMAMQKAERFNMTLKLPPKFSSNGNGSNYFKSICSEPWKNIYIDTEGAVLPCCYAGEHIGELSESDIISIWNNKKYQQLRTDLISQKPISMCEYCLNSNPANVNLLNSHVSFRPDVQKEILR